MAVIVFLVAASDDEFDALAGAPDGFSRFMSKQGLLVTVS